MSGKKQELCVGMIGLGGRGRSLLRDVILEREGVRVTAISDVYSDRMEQNAEMIREKSGHAPQTFADYHDLLASDQVQAVVISSSWHTHIPIACEAMEAGKIVGCEVGGAYTLEDCWRLVRTYEKTRTPIMMLENCCYGRNELMILNMVRQGVFGEIVHCRGGYCHDLRSEVSYGRENRHYRFDNYLHRNCENYPTHEIGPIAQVLDINRGNRMVSLYSMASKSRGLQAYLKREKGEDYDASHFSFAQGDMITTLIKCAGGETIQLNLETTTPRAYSRQFEVHGTAATYLEDNQSVFLDGGDHAACEFAWNKQWNNIETLREKYEHPIWREYLKGDVRGGHDGMDWLVLGEFFDCIEQNRPMPTDVYDMAAWMSITPLSEESIATGNTVYFPDFTSGRWVLRREETLGSSK